MKRLSPTSFPGIRSAVVGLAAIALIGLGGCASSSEKETEPEPGTGSEFSDAGATTVEKDTMVVEEVTWVDIDPVYFDFDKSDIRRDAIPTLKSAASQLNDSGLKIVIEGHCDNRGSEEYNLALGERRATSVRRYLANLGVPMSQMTVISYGELRPAAKGNTESAWSLNRRAQFVPAD